MFYSVRVHMRYLYANGGEYGRFRYVVVVVGGGVEGGCGRYSGEVDSVAG